MLPISITILSHNRLDELSINLPILLNSKKSKHEFEIIVADNNSSDGSREYLLNLKETFTELILVLNDENKGVAGGRNSAWAAANRDVIIALDDDSSINYEDIIKLMELVHKNPDVGIFAFKIIHTITKELQNPHGNVPCEVANHHGAGFAIRKSIYNRIGGIDEKIKYGADELEYAIRVHALGYKILYFPTIVVYHNSQPRERKIEISRDIGYLYNNIRLYYKYFPWQMACLNSFRYVIIYSLYWFKTYKHKEIYTFLHTVYSARKHGKKNHIILPNNTIQYYKNSRLRPEFGNVPLLTKVFQYFKK